MRPRMKHATGGRPNLLRKRSLLLAATTYLTVFLTVLATTGVTVALAQEQAATTTTTTTTPQQDAVQADCSAELASIASLKATVSSYETSTGELEKKLVEITTKTLAEADKNVKESHVATWKDMTCKDFRLEEVPGNHLFFYQYDVRNKWMDRVVESLPDGFM